MKKTVDSRLLMALKTYSPDVYEQTRALADKHMISIGAVVEHAMLNYFMLEKESRFAFLRDLDKKIQDARARARKKATEPLESDSGIPMTEPMLDLIEDANWPTEFEV